MKKDDYDLAIEYLKENPDRIFSAWLQGCSVSGGLRLGHKPDNEIAKAALLFKGVGPDNICPTTIKSGIFGGNEYAKANKQLRKDKMIPVDPCSIRIEHLPAFAKWQRKIDKAFSNKGK